MRSQELFELADGLNGLSAKEVLLHPAWQMPVKIGAQQLVLKCDGNTSADSVCLKVRFGTDECLLGLAPSAAMPEFSALFQVRDAVPETIMRAVIEKEAGALFQVLEDAVRKELVIDGLAERAGEFVSFRMHGDDKALLSFELTPIPSIVDALGDRQFLNVEHPSIADLKLDCEVEYATFALQADEIAGLASGDCLLLPEMLEEKPGRIRVRGKGANELCRVVGTGSVSVTCSEYLAADGDMRVVKTEGEPLALVLGGKIRAVGSLTKLGDMPALAIESVGVGS